MLEKIVIQKAENKVAQDILNLQREVFLIEAKLYNDYRISPLTQSLDSLLEELKTFVILVAIFEGKIIGAVRAIEKEKTCYIYRLIVHNDYQNQGIGQKLMEEMEKCFPDCHRFELYTGFKSEKNLYLYNKLGYQEFKREKVSKDLTFVYLEKNK